MAWGMPHFFWIFVIAVIAIVAAQRSTRTTQREKTIRAAIEKGAPLDPNLLATLQQTSSSPQDARTGLMTGAIVTFFVGLGLAAMGYVLSLDGNPGALRGLSAVAALLWCIALGLFVARLAIRPSSGR